MFHGCAVPGLAGDASGKGEGFRGSASPFAVLALRCYWDVMFNKFK